MQMEQKIVFFDVETNEEIEFYVIEETRINNTNYLLVTEDAEDDTEEAFRIRYKTYLEATLPLVEYYQNHGILHKIDASLTIDEVNKEITSIINKGDSND